MVALDKYYSNKVAVVTGAGSGIGRSIAQQLGRAGARLHCCDIDGKAVRMTTAEFDNAEAHTIDVVDAAAVRALADKIFDRSGRVDVLFNNAGIGHAAAITDTELDDWRRLFDVNVMGVVNGIDAFLPRMLQQVDICHLVNTASGAGLFPHPKMAPYAASKHAVVGLSTSLAAELHDRNVKVTIVCPGVVNTGIAAASTMRGETKTQQAHTIKYYEKNGVSPDKIARDVLDAVRRSKLFCLTPRGPVSLGWLLYRLSPALASRVMRAQIAKILGAP